MALGALSKCRNEPEKNSKEPCNQNAQQIPLKQTVQHFPSLSPPASWAVDDLLEFPELASSEKVITLAAFIQVDLTLVALRFCLYLLSQTVSQVVNRALTREMIGLVLYSKEKYMFAFLFTTQPHWNTRAGSQYFFLS